MDTLESRFVAGSGADENMKKNNVYYARAFCAALLLMLAPAAVPGTISYTYDPAGRLIAVDYGGGQSANYIYDNAGNLVQSSLPSPSLTFSAAANGQFSIAWPSSSAGFVLESSPVLGPGAVWSPVAAPTAESGGRIVVTLAAGATKTFYRLHR